MRRTSCLLFMFLCCKFILPASDISGFWKSMDEKIDRPAAVIGIYEHLGKMYGRLIITFNEGVVKDTIHNRTERAEMVDGSPYFAGLDFIWDLELKGKKWINGRIMDPKEGKIYHSDMWLDGDELVVRGKIKIGFISLGRNQRWLPVNTNDLPTGFSLPDLTGMVPVRHRPAE